MKELEEGTAKVRPLKPLNPFVAQLSWGEAKGRGCKVGFFGAFIMCFGGFGVIFDSFRAHLLWGPTVYFQFLGGPKNQCLLVSFPSGFGKGRDL